jgi:hypothetical protein
MKKYMINDIKNISKESPDGIVENGMDEGRKHNMNIGKIILSSLYCNISDIPRKITNVTDTITKLIYLAKNIFIPVNLYNTDRKSGYIPVSKSRGLIVFALVYRYINLIM